MGNEIERVCVENELVITTWSPIHLRTKLKELYWKPERLAIEAMVFWKTQCSTSTSTPQKQRCICSGYRDRG